MLTKRWTKLRWYNRQSDFFRSNARFVINHSGRRSGKTELAKRRFVKKALSGDPQWLDWKGFISAPVRHQVKKIYWEDIKSLFPKDFIYSINESELIIKLINSSEVHLVGMDRPERIEGIPWNHGILDEFGNMKARTLQEHVRPALADRNGSLDIIGVPEGRNHFYELTEAAKIDESGNWEIYHWPSWDILPQEEIDAAKKELDIVVFEQEFGGQFVSFTGAAYYCFDPAKHVGDYSQFYNPAKPIVFCFDFNVSPGVAVVCQEMGSDIFDIPLGQTITAVIGEVYIPAQSNTVRVCQKLIADWQQHQGLIICYGDPTGGADGTAKIRGNDWDIIKQQFYPYWGDRLYFNVPLKAPRERQRVNAVNSRLFTVSEDVRLVFDGKQAKMSIRDIEGVRVVEGTNGEINKKIDPMLTHLSDALGYYIAKEFPVHKYFSREEILKLMNK